VKADHITVEIDGAEELISELARIDKDLSGAKALEVYERVVELVAGDARDRAPHDLGYLTAGIDEEVGLVEGDPAGLVFTDIYYAPFQERGTDPYFPNLEALEEWAERHDTTAWVVAMAILRRGLVPKKFFEEALTENVDDIYSYIGEGVAEIMEKEY